MNPPSKLPRLVLGLAWAFVIAIQLLSLPRVTPAGKDTTYYLEGAKAIAEGRGYRHVLHVGEPPIRLYPPGQSAFLSPGWRLGGGTFPENYRAMALPQCVASLVAMWMLTRFLRLAGVGPIGIALSLLTAGLSPMWTAYTHFLYSEPVFCALGFFVWSRLPALVGPGAPRVDTGAVPSAESSPSKAAAAGQSQPAPPVSLVLRGWFIVGMLAGVMYLWRTAALGMIAGLALVALLFGGPRRWLALGALLLPVTLAVGFWAVVSHSDSRFTSGDYASSFQDRLRILGGTGAYAAMLWRHFTEFATGFQFVDALNALPLRSRESAVVAGIDVRGLIENFGLLLGVVFLAFLIRGAMEDRSRSNRAMVLVFGVYQLLVILWPYNLGGRPVFVLLAPALAWAWRGMHAFVPGRPAWTWVRAVAIAAAVVMFAANTSFLLDYAPYATQRTAQLRAFVASVVPSGLGDGQLAVDVDLPGVLVSRWIDHRIANLPFADEYGAAWVPILRDNVPPEYYLARTKLFDATGKLTTVHGVYRIERKSNDGELALARRDRP